MIKSPAALCLLEALIAPDWVWIDRGPWFRTSLATPFSSPFSHHYPPTTGRNALAEPGGGGLRMQSENFLCRGMLPDIPFREALAGARVGRCGYGIWFLLCVFVPLSCRMSGSSWKQMFARLDDLICVERKSCRRPSFLIRDILDEGKCLKYSLSRGAELNLHISSWELSSCTSFIKMIFYIFEETHGNS